MHVDTYGFAVACIMMMITMMVMVGVMGIKLHVCTSVECVKPPIQTLK